MFVFYRHPIGFEERGRERSIFEYELIGGCVKENKSQVSMEDRDIRQVGVFREKSPFNDIFCF